MRPDMQKLIVERPRRNSRAKSRKTALRLAHKCDFSDYDSGPRRAPSSRHGKDLNENLAPLRRYLLRQVGRPWNKVYGEIRRSIDTRSAAGLHVMQHLEDFVALHVTLENGVAAIGSWGGMHPVRGLYVHPVTGLLRLVKSPKKSK